MINLHGRNRLGNIQADHPKIYAVASGKGGVGKSVIAFNLAHSLSAAGKVLLIDGDFQMGNLHLLANVAPEHGWQAVAMEQVEFSQAIKSINDNLDLLASTDGRAGELLPEIKKLASSLAELRACAARYDFVIIDSASGILPHSNLILNAVDEVILVTTPELTSISDTYALYKILISNNEHLTASLLVNREDRNEEVEYIYQKFISITEQFLGRSPSFFGFLGDDPTMTDSVARQQGLADFAPESKITGHFAAIARAIESAGIRSGINQETINLNPSGADIKE